MRPWVLDRIWVQVVLCLCSGPLLATPDQSPEVGTDARRSINLEALSRLKGVDLETNPTVKTVVLKLLEQVRGTPQFVELVRDFKIKDQDQALLDIAVRDPNGSAGVGALRLLLAYPSSERLTGALAGGNAVQIAQGLGNTGDKAIVPLLEPLVADPARDLVLRKEALRALVKTQAGAAALLALVREHKLPDDLKLSAGLELNSVRWDDLRLQAARLLTPAHGRDAQGLPPIPELAKLRGEARNGAAVFRRETVGCLKCHQVNGEGVDFGPNLSEIGTKLAREAIYEAILDPSAGIAFGYEAWQLDLKDGGEAYGLIVSETAEEVALKAVGGVVTRYSKSAIAQRTRQKLSIMPAGLEQAMTRQELVDLVEYLLSLKRAER